jgi:hypothetical protein
VKPVAAPVVKTPVGVLLACTGLTFAAATAWAQNPWVISQPVTVDQPVVVGDVVVVTGGSLTVAGVGEPGFRIAGNLVVVGEGRASFSDSVVELESSYHGEYSLSATDQGSLELARCKVRVTNGVQYAVVAAGNAGVVVRDSDFSSAQLVAAGHGTLDASSLNGQFEVILQDQARVALHDIPRDLGQGDVWIWPTFGAGSRASYSPPLPGFISSWSFPPPGAVGLGESCTIDGCQVRLWPMLVAPGSALELHDIAAENWVVVGLLLPHDASLTGLVDGQEVVAGRLDLPDRSLELEHATIDAWNVYPEADARVVVRDSAIGELIAMDDARVWLERTVVDGSGGYFGAKGASQVTVEGSAMTCDVQVSGEATVVAQRSELRPYPVDAMGTLTHFGAFDHGRLLLVQTPTSSTAELGGSGLLVFAGLSPLPAFPPAAAVALGGTVASYSLDATLLPQRWRLEAWRRGDQTGTIVAAGEGNLISAPVGVWGGADPHASYDLRCVIGDASGRSVTAVWPVERVRVPRQRLSHGR